MWVVVGRRCCGVCLLYTESKPIMAGHDQCPSTHGKSSPKMPRTPLDLVGVGGKPGRTYWRSLEDAADTPEFREWLDREFPAGASVLLDSSRRTFLKLMGASLALAGAGGLAACRRPDHKILAYSREVPEDVVPGKALMYATAMPMPGGFAEGLLVETHEGRPTKIEGNPLHPISRGKTTAWAQSSILGLYDPDRVKQSFWTPSGPDERSWEDFVAWSGTHFVRFDANRGAGLAFVMDRVWSPTRERLRERVTRRWPSAVWIERDVAGSHEWIAGSISAFGRPCVEVFDLVRAETVVSFDRDFLHMSDPGVLRHTRDFMSRRGHLTPGQKMNRLYVVEGGHTITGGRADHRLPVAPSRIGGMLIELARELDRRGIAMPAGVMSSLQGRGLGDMSELERKHVQAMAGDLIGEVAARGITAGTGVVMVGQSQPAWVHALGHAINAAIGAPGKTVRYTPLPAHWARHAESDLADLSARMRAGDVNTLVCLNSNPVYDAPAGSGFAEAFDRVEHTIALSVDSNETVQAAKWKLPGAHTLEAWGDAVGIDGTLSAVQPMIAPLYRGHSDIEVVAAALGEAASGYDLVRETWRSRRASGGGTTGFETRWRRALHNGVAEGDRAAEPASMTLDPAGVSRSVTSAATPASVGPRSLDVVFVPGQVADGRYNNNGWLQELPEPVTTLVWDNAAMVSPATATALGLESEVEESKKRRYRVGRITIGGQSLDIPFMTVPGMADNTIVLPMGYGRTVVGDVGVGTGFNTYRLRSAGVGRMAGGASVARSTGGEGVGRWFHLVRTQMHHAMHGRALVREVDKPAWDRYGADPFVGLSDDEKKRVKYDGYGRPRDLNFAERLGELEHTPRNVSAYDNPQRGTDQPFGLAEKNRYGNKPDFASKPQWGMTIDLSTCTGCGTCTVACQSENNIPIVGKIETEKGREMHWIRVDRYFITEGDASNPLIGDGAGETGMVFQPVACVHCENAPCETVCPVNATVHGPSGMNYMVYNRCIGTRYCANNCPYKVRRFNWFQYADRKFRNSLIHSEDVGEPLIQNENLIPPRLRKKIEEIRKLGMNPDVTVRTRGVMEKCSYCVQRVNEARWEAKLQDLEHIPDGFFQTACQQACPSDAIVFGDILDDESRVTKARTSGRSYLLLGFLNTQPRTSYLLGIKNPNPTLREPVVNPFHNTGDHGHGHGDEYAMFDGEDGVIERMADGLGFVRAETAQADVGYRMSLSVMGGGGGGGLGGGAGLPGGASAFVAGGGF